MRSRTWVRAAALAATAGLAVALAPAAASAAQAPAHGGIRPGLARVVSVGLQVRAVHASVSTVSATGLAAGASDAARLLYSQDNHPSGDSPFSVNFGKGDTRDRQVADDFTVPRGDTWTITQVNVTGAQDGTPVSENVFFYKNTVNAKKQDVPGTLVKNGKQTLKGEDSDGSLVITGIKDVALPAGHYWLSVQANMTGTSDWGWGSRTVQHGSPAVLKSPNAATCTTWTRWVICNKCPSYLKQCGPDLMFALYGSSTAAANYDLRLHLAERPAVRALGGPGRGNSRLCRRDARRTYP